MIRKWYLPNEMASRSLALLLVTASVPVAIGTPAPGYATAPSTPQSRTIRTVADQTNNHHGNDHDSSGAHRPGRPDKSEPTHSGLRGAGLLGADLTKPGAVANGLAGTLVEVALSPNRTIIQGDAHPVAAGQVSDFEVACPIPFKVVNGGESNTGEYVRLTKNYPVTTPSSSGWHVQVHNDDGVARDYRVYADCINGLTQYQRLSHTDPETAPGDYDSDVLDCPGGRLALGGGYSVEKGSQVAINSSDATMSGWELAWRNVGSSAAQITAYVMCASGAIPSYGLTVGTDSRANEYQQIRLMCDSGYEELAAGWAQHEAGKSITVTDSFPTPDGQVVWAHNPDRADWVAYAECGTVP